MSKLLSASLLTCLLMQISTYPVVHGFFPDQIGLMVAEGVVLLVCLLNWRKGGILFGLAISGALFHFWPLLSQHSWAVSSAINTLSGWLSEAFGTGFGISSEGFRVDGIAVVADPSKTGALAFCVWLTIFMLQTIFETGIFSCFAPVAHATVFAVLFTMIRWIGFSAFLGWVQPNLVFHGWHLFWGVGLAFSLLLFSLLFGEFRRKIDAQEIVKSDVEPISAETIIKPQDQTTRQGRIMLAGWLLLLSVIFILINFPGGFGGESKTVRVMIDETHSQWEPLRIPAQQEENYVFYENNYGGWLSYIEQIASVTVAYPTGTTTPDWEFQSERIFSDELTPEILSPAKFDLLILKCPTTRYSQEEKETILRFVEEGGTLWAIGEHTDVFFINTFLNEVLAPAGAKLRSDGICDHAGRWLVTNGPLHSLLPWSPGQTPFMWATGASIQGDYRMIPLAVSSPDAFSDRWVPTNQNFFGKLEPDTGHLYGPFVLSAMVPLKKGKIIIHGDSTNFNCSMLSSPGKWELTRNVVVNCRSGAHLVTIAIFIEILFGLMTFSLLGMMIRKESPLAAIIICAVFLSVFCGSFFSNTFCRKPLFAAWQKGPRMVIDFSLKPSIGLNYGHQQNVTAADSFDPVLVQLQRLKVAMSPSFQSLKDVLTNDVPALLLADPVSQPDAQDLSSLKKWVQGGGHLFMVSAGQVAGPLRTMSLCLGLEESSDRPLRGAFPALHYPGNSSSVDAGEMSFMHHTIGSGTVCIIFNWSQKTREAIDYPTIAKTLFKEISEGM